jgi:hypothetical protein
VPGDFISGLWCSKLPGEHPVSSTGTYSGDLKWVHIYIPTSLPTYLHPWLPVATKRTHAMISTKEKIAVSETWNYMLLVRPPLFADMMSLFKSQ